MSQSGAAALRSASAANENPQAKAVAGAARLAPLRLVYEALTAHLGRPLRVLEINCGQGFFALHLAAWGATVIGIDSEPGNITQAQNAARNYPGLAVQFLGIPMKAILDTVKPGDFDLVVDFFFQKWVYAYGFAWARTALRKIGEKSGAGLFGIDLAAVHTAAPENPDRLFDGFSCYSRLDDDHPPPLYFASNAVALQDGQCVPPGEHPPRDAFEDLYERHNGYRFRAPDDLAVTPLPIRRVLLIGTCLVSRWVDVVTNAHDGSTCDQVLFNLADMPPEPPQPVANYDFQVVQIPLRYILPDQKLFELAAAAPERCRAIFDETVEAMRHYLDAGLHWNKRDGLLAFVVNFFVPQQNPLGRLMPRYDLRNVVYFVEQLNMILARDVVRYKNAYYFDVDIIAASFGKKYIQDDGIYQSSHAGELSDFDYESDRDRLEPPLLVTRHYRSEAPAFMHACWADLVAAYRTIRQTDMVKLVAVDLDDTLWRGVLADTDTDNPWVLEGWPLGMIEALKCLKARGVLLAIVSKNEEDRVGQMWERVMGKLMKLEDFAVRKINRRPKAENLEEILRETNLLPRHAVFIDDNPVERAGIAAAFPDVRVLGSHIYYLRRVLLWAPETQVAALSDEAGRRTDMVQAQVAREEQRKRMSREEFLASLQTKVRLRRLDGVADEKFPRAFELLNKTNQFNTTGKRWTHEECAALFAAGGAFYTFDAEDRFTAYGLIGVIIVRGGTIEQMAMSCRVAGMDIEIAAMSGVIAALPGALTARVVETDANAMARDLFQRCGFSSMGNGVWAKAAGQPLPAPAHIELVVV
jgi:FkbH-like protein